jgi:hypothetical protein
MTVVYIDGLEWGQQHPDINSRPITFSRLNTRLPLSKLNRLIWVGPVLNLRAQESAAAFYRLKVETTYTGGYVDQAVYFFFFFLFVARQGQTSNQKS